MLKQIDDTKGKGKLGTLDAVDGILPDELTNEVRNLDGSVDAGQGKLKKTNVISITGGGHEFTYEEGFNDARENYSGTCVPRG